MLVSAWFGVSCMARLSVVRATVVRVYAAMAMSGVHFGADDYGPRRDNPLGMPTGGLGREPQLAFVGSCGRPWVQFWLKNVGHFAAIDRLERLRGLC